MRPENVTLSELDFKGLDLNAIQEVVPFEQRSLRIYGKLVLQPRLVRWYGPVAYRYSGLTLPACPLPALLESIRQQVELQVGCPFNSVLCNLYRDGQDYVSWHSDNESIFGGDPVVASLSFGAPRLFKLRLKKDHKQQQCYTLTDRSLLVMGKGVQIEWEHTVPKTNFPGKRINLTFRQTV